MSDQLAKLPETFKKWQKHPSTHTHKWCGRCRSMLPFSDFRKNRSKKSGLSDWCRLCADQAWYNRFYSNPEARERHYATVKRWKKSENGILSMRNEVKRYRKKYPEKVRARNKINGEIRAGRLRRQECEVCGSPNANAHHADYSKPLEVRWLCDLHHTEVHVYV